MRDLSWSRLDAIVRLRRDIWRYVTQAAETDDDVVLMAAALLQMPSGQVRYLAQLHFILSDEVGRLLDQMPFLIRRLTTTSMSEIEVSAERIRGPIRWGETFAQRAATGSPNTFVTAPTRRAFDTPENQVLGFALRAVAEFGTNTGWHKSETIGPAQVVRERVADATRWRQARPLTGLGATVPTPTTLQRVRASRSRRRYEAALDVVGIYSRYIARLDRQALRDAVEQRALVASRDSVLLELECAFDTMRTLRDQGWRAPPDALLRPPLIFRGDKDGAQIGLFFQSAPPALTSGSRYRAVQHAHEFASTGGLIPDLVIRLHLDGTTRWLLIEVKGGPKRGVADSARAAVLDLFAYRRAFGATLAAQRAPYGLAYAWGAQLDPATDSEVAMCTPDTLPVALRLLLQEMHA